MKNKLDGYFTVEAALVVPVVAAVILFVIYQWFFQYDRCLMEIDTNAAVLRASNAKVENNDERMSLTKKYLNEVYYDKYAAWNGRTASIKIEKGSMCVEREGSVKFPFGSLEFWNGNKMWESQIRVKADIIDPAFVVRSIHKLKGGN